MSKKTASKGSPTRPSRPAPRAAAAAPDAPLDDPQAQAQLFMQLLDSLEGEGPEAVRIRSALINIVAEYSAAESRGEDIEEVRKATSGRLLLLEYAVADVLLKSSKKMRDRIVAESRRLGVRSKVGQAARDVAEGLNLMVEGLTKMQQSAQRGDDALRLEARALITQAKRHMESVGA